MPGVTSVPGWFRKEAHVEGQKTCEFLTRDSYA